MRRYFRTKMSRSISTPIVSVIATFFNNEKYIAQCIDSIKRQTFRDIEVTCIDDCSTDSSYSTLQGAVCGDHRFRIIRNDVNRGISFGRNKGIQESNCEYIMGVDGDDFIERDAIKSLLNAMDGGRNDIAVSGFRICDQNGKKLASKKIEGNLYTDHNKLTDPFNNIKPSFWGKIWKRSLFVDNDIWFPDRLHFQDLATTPRIISAATNIKTVSQALYNYRNYAGSVTNSMTAKHTYDYFKVFDILKNHFSVKGNYFEHQQQFIEMINSNIDYHIETAKHIKDTDETDFDEYRKRILHMKSAYLASI